MEYCSAMNRFNERCGNLKKVGLYCTRHIHLHTGGISEFKRPNRSNAKKSRQIDTIHDENIQTFKTKPLKLKRKKIINNDEIEYYKMRFPFDLSCSCREARDSIMLHHDSNGVWIFDKFETVVDQFYSIMNEKILNLKYTNCEEFIIDCKLFEKAITRFILTMGDMKGKLKEIEAHIDSVLEIFTDSCNDLEDNVENDVCSLDDKVLSMSSTRNDSYVAEFFTDSISAAIEESDDRGIAIDDDSNNIGAATIKVLHMLYTRGQSTLSLIHVNNDQKNIVDNNNNNINSNSNFNLINKEKHKRKRQRTKPPNNVVTVTNDTRNSSDDVPVAVTCSRAGRIINPKHIYDSSEGIINYDKKYSSTNSLDFIPGNINTNAQPQPIVKVSTNHLSTQEKKTSNNSNITKIDKRYKQHRIAGEQVSCRTSIHNQISSIESSQSNNNNNNNCSNSNNKKINYDSAGKSTLWGKSDQELQLLHQQANSGSKMSLNFNNNNNISVFEKYQIQGKSGNQVMHSSNEINSSGSEYGSIVPAAKGNMYTSGSNNSSNKKGVAVMKVKKYAATIEVCNRTIKVGQFDSEIEAAIAHDRVLMRAIGPSNCSPSALNYPIENYSEDKLESFSTFDSILKKELFGSGWTGTKVCDFGFLLMRPREKSLTPNTMTNPIGVNKISGSTDELDDFKSNPAVTSYDNNNGSSSNNNPIRQSVNKFKPNSKKAILLEENIKNSKYQLNSANNVNNILRSNNDLASLSNSNFIPENMFLPTLFDADLCDIPRNVCKVLGQELYRLQKIMLNLHNDHIYDDSSLDVLPWEESVIILGLQKSDAIRNLREKITSIIGDTMNELLLLTDPLYGIKSVGRYNKQYYIDIMGLNGYRDNNVSKYIGYFSTQFEAAMIREQILDTKGLTEIEGHNASNFIGIEWDTLISVGHHIKFFIRMHCNNSIL